MTALLWLDLQRRDMAECHTLLCCSSTVCGDSQKQSSLTRRCGACRKRKLFRLSGFAVRHGQRYNTLYRAKLLFITQIQHANTSFDLQLALRYTLCAAADRLRDNHMRYMLCGLQSLAAFGGKRPCGRHILQYRMLCLRSKLLAGQIHILDAAQPAAAAPLPVR